MIAYHRSVTFEIFVKNSWELGRNKSHKYLTGWYHSTIQKPLTVCLDHKIYLFYELTTNLAFQDLISITLKIDLRLSRSSSKKCWEWTHL